MSIFIVRSETISTIFDLHTKAASMHERLLRQLPVNDTGIGRGEINRIALLTAEAEKLHVISAFNYSARGVVFLQKRKNFMSLAPLIIPRAV